MLRKERRTKQHLFESAYITVVASRIEGNENTNRMRIGTTTEWVQHEFAGSLSVPDMRWDEKKEQFDWKRGTWHSIRWLSWLSTIIFFTTYSSFSSIINDISERREDTHIKWWWRLEQVVQQQQQQERSDREILVVRDSESFSLCSPSMIRWLDGPNFLTRTPTTLRVDDESVLSLTTTEADAGWRCNEPVTRAKSGLLLNTRLKNVASDDVVLYHAVPLFSRDCQWVGCHNRIIDTTYLIWKGR